MKQLKQLVIEMTNNAAIDDNKKNTIMNKMRLMKETPIEVSNQEVECEKTVKV